MAEEGRRDHPAQLCDTNVLVRFLTGEPRDQAEAAARALRSGGPVFVTDVVVAELCYVLTSFYGLSAAVAAERVAGILALPSVQVGDIDVLFDALALWSRQRLGFPDAYLAAIDRSTSATTVLSFDRDFDRIEGVERVDPARY